MYSDNKLDVNNIEKQNISEQDRIHMQIAKQRLTVCANSFRVVKIVNKGI